MVMQRATHPSPIAIVSDHVEAWRRDNRWSRETVADLIVQAHIRIGGPVITGINFEPPTTDTFERMRVNADKIFRWLDDRSKDRNLMTVNFLWSVLAALPEDRRVLCANDLLHPVCLHVELGHDGDDDVTHEEIAEAFNNIFDSLSLMFAGKLLDGVHPGEAEHAATIGKARGLMSRLIKRRTS